MKAAASEASVPVFARVVPARPKTALASRMMLEVGGVKKTLPAEIPASDPQTLVFRIGMEKSGMYRILFETNEGEKNVDRNAYAIDVLDRAGTRERRKLRVAGNEDVADLTQADELA